MSAPLRYLLDTSIFRPIVYGEEPVRQRLLSLSPQQIWLSAIAVEEVLAGYLSVIQRLRTSGNGLRIGEVHQDMASAIRQIARFQILSYEERAEIIFQAFPSKIKRIGTQDCRIAAQALADDLIVVTRNREDFTRIGARCEDWTVREE